MTFSGLPMPGGHRETSSGPAGVDPSGVEGRAHPYRPMLAAPSAPRPGLLSRGSPGAIALALSLSGPLAFVAFCAAVRGSGYAEFLPSTVLYGAIGYALFVFGVLGWARRRS